MKTEKDHESAEQSVKSDFSNVEKVGKREKKKKVSAKLVRVGICECGYEWKAHNGNDEKPSRCPKCKSRCVRWRDEITMEEYVNLINNVKSKEVEKVEKELEKEKDGKMENIDKIPNLTDKSDFSNVEKEMEKVEKVEKESETEPEIFGKREPETKQEKFTMEDAEKAVPKIPMQAIVIVLGGAAILGAILYFRRKIAERNETRMFEIMQQKQQNQQSSKARDALRRRCGITDGGN